MKLVLPLLFITCCSHAAQIQLSWFPSSSATPVTIYTSTNVNYTIESLTETTNRVKRQWGSPTAALVLQSWAYYHTSLKEQTLVTTDMITNWSVLATRPENTGTYMVTVDNSRMRFFAVVDDGSDSVELGWNASPPANVIGYRLYYGAASHTYTNSVDLGKVLTGTVTGLVKGQTYWFAVTADDSNGKESILSGEISYTVPVTGYQVFIRKI